MTEPEFRKFRLSDLNPAVYNPRIISDESLEGLQSCLAKYGCVEPIVVNVRDGRNVIVGGHQRQKALIKLHGRDAEATCAVVDLDTADEKLLNLALNNPHIQGDFISDLDSYIDQIRGELDDDQAYFDLQIDKLRGEIGDVETEKDPDEVPEVPDEAITQPGDTWILGDHKLICGDSTDEQLINGLLDGNQADMVFTDPPYNMAYKSKALGGIKNDNMAEAEFVRFILASMLSVKKSLRRGGSYYVCMSAAEYPLVFHQLRKLGMSGKQIVWMKPSAGMGSQEYRPQYEVMLFGYAGSRDDRTWNGGRKQSDLWEFDLNSGVIAREDGDGMIIEVGSGIETAQICLDTRSEGTVFSFDGNSSDIWKFGRAKGGYVHPTQKPISLVERAIYNSSNTGDLVLEPFAGSGTTIIACERMKRRCFAIELDPKYCDVIVNRWQEWTGKTAERIEA